MRDRLAGQDGVEGFAELGLGRLITLLAEILDPIVDAAQVLDFAVGRQHRGLRRHGGIHEADQFLARIDQEREAVAELLGILGDGRVGDGRIHLKTQPAA